jgi:hypothetical protein
LTVRDRTFAAACEVASRLAMPSADGIVASFLDCLDIATSNAAANTTISSTSVPLEVSFTGRPGSEGVLRLLAEPLEPGGGAIGRCYLGVSALVRLLERLGAHREPAMVGQVVADVFPSGGERTWLPWNAAIWLALRTDGHHTGVRAYVNMHNRRVGDRYLRAISVLEHLGLAADADGVRRLAGLVGTWATPIGLSLDFAAGTARTARLHFNMRSLSYRRVSMLLSGVAPAGLGDLLVFLGTFGITPGGSAHPLLLSVGFEGTDIDSVKCDITVSAESPGSAAEQLVDLERRFGSIVARHLTADLFADPELLRYVGLTVSRRQKPYLNVYYSAPEPATGPHRRHLPPCNAGWPATLARGLRFVGAQQDADGSVRAEARSTGPSGLVAAHRVADVLVTSLVHTEGGRLPLPPAGIKERSLRQRLRHGPPVVQSSGDGGLVWSADGSPGSSDPTATFCVLAGVLPAPGGWDPARTCSYLRRWLDAPGSPAYPACPAGCRSLLPIYLAAAAPTVVCWFGQPVKRRLRAEVLSQQRHDGCWGLAGPEALETALAVLTLDLVDQAFWREESHVGCRRALVKFLSGVQYSDGGWCWAPVLCDGLSTWFGHRAVTTVFVVRALNCLTMTQTAGEL